MRRKEPYILPDGTSIPGVWYENPTRFVSTDYGWKRLREWGSKNILWCAKAVRYQMHIGREWHHIYGGGAGGARRDDRIEVDGKPNLSWLCREHHNEMPIKRREPSL